MNQFFFVMLMTKKIPNWYEFRITLLYCDIIRSGTDYLRVGFKDRFVGIRFSEGHNMAILFLHFFI